MTRASFFGYGSLVNLKTHDYPNAQVAHLRGWRRVWRHTATRPVAYLSVERDTGSRIAGVVADVPGGDWAALDLREAAYARQDVTALIDPAPRGAEIAVYEVEASASAPTEQHPILLSYLDVVVQGYLAMFGTSGVVEFFDTTQGWDAPVLNDREDPRYPRHQRLSAKETHLVDASLRQLGVQVVIAPT